MADETEIARKPIGNVATLIATVDNNAKKLRFDLHVAPLNERITMTAEEAELLLRISGA